MKEGGKQIGLYWWESFKGMRRVRWITWFLGILLLLGLLANMISSDRPYTCVFQGERLYPLFQPGKLIAVAQPGGDSLVQPLERIRWHEQVLEHAWWPPIPYGNSARQNHRGISPFGKQKLRNQEPLSARWRHWLGTDQSGRDILAMMLRGIRISLGIGVLATGIAALIGFLIGGLAGYFGDNRLRLPRGSAWISLLVVALAIWLGFIRKAIVFQTMTGWAWWREWLSGLVVAMLVVGMVVYPLWRWKWRHSSRKKAIRIDFWISRLIEVLDSLPQLLLIISIGAVLSRDLWTFILLIGFTSWSGIARLVRAESLRIRDSDYITAARVAGIPARRILTAHVWPQVLPPLLIPLAFGIGNVMIAESSLSFLNIIEKSGSWGAILSEATHVRQLWWVPVFPGLAIFLVVLSVNILGESLRKAMNHSQNR